MSLRNKPDTHPFTSFQSNQPQVVAQRSQLFFKETLTLVRPTKLCKHMVRRDIVKPIHHFLQQWLFLFCLGWCSGTLAMDWYCLFLGWLWYFRSINWQKWAICLSWLFHIGTCLHWWDSSRLTVGSFTTIFCQWISTYLGRVTTWIVPINTCQSQETKIVFTHSEWTLFGEWLKTIWIISTV